MKYPLNEPFQAEAGQVISDLFKLGFKAKLAIFDLPYNTTKEKWDFFDWTSYPYDLIQEICDYVLITPGIRNFSNFLRSTSMTYRWLLNCHVSNMHCRADVGFSKQIPFILFARPDVSISRSIVDSYKIQLQPNKSKNHIDGYWYPKGQKPLELIERLIHQFSAEGDIILDLFSGGFTTACASIIGKRQYLCSDISDEAVRIGQNRIKVALNQINITNLNNYLVIKKEGKKEEKVGYKNNL